MLIPPNQVKNSWQANDANQNEVNIDFIYNEEQKTLTIHHFLIPVDAGLVYNEPTPLFELVFV